MAIFRLQDNVPDVYNRKSRDFQLLCNIFDIVQNGVKFDIDSIADVVDTEYCNSSLLNYLKSELGFISNLPLDDNTQRTILKAFPYLIKNKGTTNGIIQALNLYLRANNINGKVQCNLTNKSEHHKEPIRYIENVYIVDLMLQSTILNMKLLDELLKFIIPTGYKIRYQFYSNQNFKIQQCESDTIQIYVVERKTNDVIVPSDTELEIYPSVALSETTRNYIVEQEDEHYDNAFITRDDMLFITSDGEVFSVQT